MEATTEMKNGCCAAHLKNGWPCPFSAKAGSPFCGVHKKMTLRENEWRKQQFGPILCSAPTSDDEE